MYRIALAFLFILSTAVVAAEPAKVVPPEVAKLIAARDASADDFRKKIQAASVAWCEAVNVTPLPVPKLGADPRASEVAIADEVQRVNMRLERFAAERGGRDWNPEVARQLVEGDFPAVVARAAELRAGKP